MKANQRNVKIRRGMVHGLKPLATLASRLQQLENEPELVAHRARRNYSE